MWTIRPYRACYLLACLGIGIIIAAKGAGIAAVIVTFLLIQFDITVRK